MALPHPTPGGTLDMGLSLSTHHTLQARLIHLGMGKLPNPDLDAASLFLRLPGERQILLSGGLKSEKLYLVLLHPF